jgi:hypothetical protein
VEECTIHLLNTPYGEIARLKLEIMKTGIGATFPQPLLR